MKSAALARGFFKARRAKAGVPYLRGPSAMRHASSKKIPYVATKRATIYLLEGPTTIKLPVPGNPVHKMQAQLEKQLVKAMPATLRDAQRR
jgi:hypothetical protein